MAELQPNILQILGQNLPQSPGNLTSRGQRLSGILGGLRGFTGVAGGLQAARDAESLRQEELARQNRELDIKEATSGAFGGTKDPFLTALNILNDPNQLAGLDPQSQQDLRDFVATRAKGVETLRAQSGATEGGKLTEQLELKPEIQRRIKEAEAGVELRTAPKITAAEATSRIEATNKANATEDLQQARTSFGGLEEGIARLKTDLKANPNLVGPLSKPSAVLSQATRGKAGFTTEEMKKRGQITNQVSIAGFQMLKFATENGLSGINTVSEAKRAIGKLTADSTAEEIEGAADALLDARRDMLAAMEARAGIPAQSTGGIQQEFSPQDIEAELRRRGL